METVTVLYKGGPRDEPDRLGQVNVRDAGTLPPRFMKVYLDTKLLGAYRRGRINAQGLFVYTWEKK